MTFSGPASDARSAVEVPGAGGGVPGTPAAALVALRRDLAARRAFFRVLAIWPPLEVTEPRTGYIGPDQPPYGSASAGSRGMGVGLKTRRRLRVKTFG